ncbi:Heavy metal-associated domain [Macleaya cordata]|uniref:Heavy metal-associated domain n=1 Tax=Macleaya cordata TaxID=56857 RepID=A0A200Q8R6_MACCD|nr:Heavy metal-associated domain [Macleaya cordata]
MINQVIVLKVSINCYQCKTDLMKVVAKLMGVDEMSVDAEKGTLTVKGKVDPVLVVNQLRKAKKAVEVISVGPPKPPPEKPKPPCPPLPPLPFCCRECQVIEINTFVSSACSIL